MVYKMVSETISIQVGDHILGIFENDEKFEAAFDYLKEGFEKNEAVLIMTDEMSKKSIRERITQSWKIDDIDTLEVNRKIIIKTPHELLLPDGSFNLKRNLQVWKDWTNIILENGKSALRVFADSSCILKHGLENEVHKFETALEKKFDYRCTIVCAYSPKDIQKMGKFGLEKLREHHNIVWQPGKRHTEPIHKCKRCGKEFETDSDAIYCSFECSYDIERN